MKHPEIDQDLKLLHSEMEQLLRKHKASGYYVVSCNHQFRSGFITADHMLFTMTPEGTFAPRASALDSPDFAKNRNDTFSFFMTTSAMMKQSAAALDKFMELIMSALKIKSLKHGMSHFPDSPGGRADI